MTQQEYEKAKAACWDAFWKENFKGHPVPPTMSIGEVFDYAFAKGYEVGSQMEAAEETVISGWVARDADTQLVYLYSSMPTRGINMWNGHGSLLMPLDVNKFPDLTWDDDPIEVELIIKRKKKTENQ